MDEDFADNAVVRSNEWKRASGSGRLDPEIDNRLQAGDEKTGDGGLIVHSLSGKERNNLFLNGEAGKDFTDVSGLSGMDSDSDGRCFALLDYDRDGWQDVVMINANQPLMQLFHNDIAQLPGATGGMVAIRFVGGATTAQSSAFSVRDGYGAVVELTLSGGQKIVREHRCGEGYATQNSTTMVVGIGERDGVDSLSVRWPSGKTTTLDTIPEGTLVTAFENSDEGDFTQAPYRSGRALPTAPASVESKPFPLARKTPGKMQVYTTTATWCAACLGHLPELGQLKEAGIAIYAVPVDPNDDEAKLADYVARHKPPYEMLTDIGNTGKDSVSAFIAEAQQNPNPPLPSSVILDPEGNVVEVLQGIPTVSQVRRLKR